jgi:hypothetical protein
MFGERREVAAGAVRVAESPGVGDGGDEIGCHAGILPRGERSLGYSRQPKWPTF